MWLKPKSSTLTTHSMGRHKGNVIKIQTAAQLLISMAFCIVYPHPALRDNLSSQRAGVHRELSEETVPLLKYFIDK